MSVPVGTILLYAGRIIDVVLHHNDTVESGDK